MSSMAFVLSGGYHVTRQVQFASRGMPAVQLVGMLHEPSAQSGDRPGVILCHPQPLVADMDDPLTLVLAERLAGIGFAALRFNFRGVAPSEGDFSDGRLEPLDLAGAVAWLAAQPSVDGRRLALVGHAFGAIVALSYAGADPSIGALVAVSPPHFRLAPGLGATLDRSKLFVTGEDDEVCPPYKLEAWSASLPEPRGLSVIRGAQHLMHGQENAAAGVIVGYLSRWASLATQS